MKLPPFDAAAICPKCHGKDISAQLHKAERYTNHCWEWKCGGPAAEHIHRHCRRCHFEWNESPLDAVTKDDQKPSQEEKG